MIRGSPVRHEFLLRAADTYSSALQCTHSPGSVLTNFSGIWSKARCRCDTVQAAQTPKQPRLVQTRRFLHIRDYDEIFYDVTTHANDAFLQLGRADRDLLVLSTLET